MDDWIKARNKCMPTQETICKRIRDRLFSQTRPASPVMIAKNFDRLILRLEEECYALYLQEEKKVNSEVLEKYFLTGAKKNGIKTAAEMARLIGRKVKELDAFFLSLKQARTSKAGSTFESNLKWLFRRLPYPFDEQIVINGQPDFLLPSEAAYRQHATDCIIFTAKRTLRERWRQIVTEGTRGHGFYLATLDGKISQNQIQEMKNNRIYLVIPKKIIQEVPVYRDQSSMNVISFADFFKYHFMLIHLTPANTLYFRQWHKVITGVKYISIYHLNPAMKRWRKNGLLKLNEPR